MKGSIKAICTALLINCFISFTGGVKLYAEEQPIKNISNLTKALKSIDHPVVTAAATELLSVEDNQDYNLHLRNADLDYTDIKLIADAIKTVHLQGGPVLRSFSVSYNPELGDKSILLLIDSLPQLVTEIGLVSSGIGDSSVNALLQWAQKAPNLRWLCVEENTFSDTVKNTLKQFGEDRQGLLVVQ